MEKHGDTKNRRQETSTTYTTYQTPQGEIVLPTLSITQTVQEKFCVVCGEWKTAKGIMGALLCVDCGTPWDLRFAEPRDGLCDLCKHYVDGPNGSECVNFETDCPFEDPA